MFWYVSNIPQINNMRRTDDQPKPTSSIPSLCQKQVIASQYWHVEGNQCTSKRQVSKSHIQHRTKIYCNTYYLRYWRTPMFFIISRVVCIILKLKKTPAEEKSDLSKGLDWYLSRCQSNNPLQGLVDLMVFLQQHVQESSCMLDMDMAASIHWMLLEVRFLRRILWLEQGKMFGKVLVWGWMCRPCWCCNISHLCGIFCGIEECVKSSSEMFQVTSQSFFIRFKVPLSVGEVVFFLNFVCTTFVYIHIYRFAGFIQLVYAIL